MVAAQEWPAVLERMASRIAHRGPDDCGYWLDEASGIALGHRRLSVIDLSVEGHQPMVSPSGRFVIAFNGEIYNYRALRDELAPREWRGHSDTETLLAAFEVWGVEGTLERSVGMFAFALWDRESHSLVLARDRLGEKPLYYGWQGPVFLFGSELRALKAHPAFVGDIDRNALTQLLRHNAIGAPLSIYRGVRKLEPGCLLRVSPSASPGDELRPVQWWSLRGVALRGLSDPYRGSAQDAVEQLQLHLLEAVRLQQVADVPIGAFLSGGIDSSTVAALLQAQASEPVRTFSIGFHEEGYDEAQHAAKVARHLGTHHTELYVSPEQALAVIPRLPHIWDEPFADSSQIPTFLVAQLARSSVTVALSGDGGDELFAGYDRYFVAQRVWSRLKRFPAALRKTVGATVRRLDPDRWDRLLRWLPGGIEGITGDRMHKLSEIVGVSDFEQFYRQVVSLWKDPASIVLGGAEPDYDPMPEGLGIFDRMMLFDGIHYLPTDILAKVDRAAMSVGLETRVPLLDHRVVEFAWRLPVSLKVRQGVSKWPLRQVLYRHVPQELVERPKMGFGVPLASWLRGPLRQWADSLLDESRLRREGFFDPIPIRRMWLEHLQGKRQWHYYLWNVLMFEAWLEAQ